MGIAVEVVHAKDGPYRLSVNHPEISGTLTIPSRAVAQRVQDFLVDELNPDAFIPLTQERALAELAAQAQELGLYDDPPPLKPATVAALETIGQADAEDNVGELKAGEAHR